MPSEPDLWRCETCGQTFVGRNMPHSCTVVALDDHFAAAPALRPVFDAYLAAAELNGPSDVDAEVRSWLAEAYAVGEQRHLPG